MKYFRIILIAEAPGVVFAQNPDYVEDLGSIAAPTLKDAESLLGFKDGDQAPDYLRWKTERYNRPRVILEEQQLFQNGEQLRRTCGPPEWLRRKQE